jgi:F-type H+-transporting ATPase subunit a
VKWLIALGVLALVVIGFLFFRLPQPIIEIAPEALFSIGPLEVTNTILTAWIMIVLIFLITFFGTRKLSLIPSGFQNLFEAVIEGFANIANNVAGEKNGRRFFPVVFILFFYIIFCNWAALTPLFNVIGVTDNVLEHVQHEAHEHPDAAFGETGIQGWVMDKGTFTVVPLFQSVDFIEVEVPEGATNLEAEHLLTAKIEEELGRPLDEETETFGFIAPFLRGVNTDVNAPLAYAIWSAIFVEFWGITALGLFAYGSKFFNFGRLFKGDILNGLIDVFVGFLELISEVARLISFTFRLFGNIFAGEVLLFMMSFLVPFVLVDIFYGLELFVGLIQAFVFAMLTLVFGVMAVSVHAEHAEDNGSQHHAAEGHS